MTAINLINTLAAHNNLQGDWGEIPEGIALHMLSILSCGIWQAEVNCIDRHGRRFLWVAESLSDFDDDGEPINAFVDFYKRQGTNFAGAKRHLVWQELYDGKSWASHIEVVI